MHTFLYFSGCLVRSDTIRSQGAYIQLKCMIPQHFVECTHLETSNSFQNRNSFLRGILLVEINCVYSVIVLLHSEFLYLFGNDVPMKASNVLCG